jgi:hypothetical protein
MQNLQSGEEFTVGPFSITREAALAYVESAHASDPHPDGIETVSPMAAAGRGLGALVEELGMPAGSVHIGQDLSFRRHAPIGQDLLCHAKVSRTSSRGGWRILALDIDVRAGDQPIVSGRTTVMSPEEGA